MIKRLTNQWAKRNAKSEYTKAEMRFLGLLSKYKIPFVTQVPMELPIQPEDVRHIHIVPDFVIGKHLIVFIDGDIHEIERIKHKDIQVDFILKNQLNHKVLRFSNEDVMDKNLEDGIIKKIWDNILNI